LPGPALVKKKLADCACAGEAAKASAATVTRQRHERIFIESSGLIFFVCIVRLAAALDEHTAAALIPDRDNAKAPRAEPRRVRSTIG
jgi:hypothetical protein